AIGALGSAQRIALSGEVLFGSGTYQLKSEATAAIDAAMAKISRDAVQSIVVAGHTDAVGSAKPNQQLSENRAKTVASYLTAQAGFDPANVTTTGYGESQPVADNDTASGRAQNRRVEITVRAEQT